MVKATAKDGNSEVAKITDGLTEDALANVTSYADVAEMFNNNIENAADILGNGFGVLEDKMRLVNVEFVIVKYGQHGSEVNGEKFSTIHIVTRDGEKMIVNDGGTGIHMQCSELQEKRGFVAPLFVKRGLRVSEYDYTDPSNGKTSKAKTFYINTGK